MLRGKRQGSAASVASIGITSTNGTKRTGTAEPRAALLLDCSAVRIFSGIQPTGRKHLGNYIGAIRQYVEGQDRGEPGIYCVVDLHAITVAYGPPSCASAC